MLDKYQVFTNSSVVYPREQQNQRIVEAMYLGLGLGGETGEVLEQLKKWHRDGKKPEIEKELGDILWYVSQLCNLFGFRIEDVIQHNIEKLTDRQERGKLHGSGDTR